MCRGIEYCANALHAGVKTQNVCPSETPLCLQWCIGYFIKINRIPRTPPLWLIYPLIFRSALTKKHTNFTLSSLWNTLTVSEVHCLVEQRLECPRRSYRSAAKRALSHLRVAAVFTLKCSSGFWILGTTPKRYTVNKDFILTSIWLCLPYAFRLENGVLHPSHGRSRKTLVCHQDK